MQKQFAKSSNKQRFFKKEPSQNLNESQQMNPFVSDCLLKITDCPYHHREIKYLCISNKCKASRFAFCEQEDCKLVHQCPDLDIIQIQKFNKIIENNTFSLALVVEKVQKYFQDLKEGLIHRIDLDIERSKTLLEQSYLNEIIKLIKYDKISQISSYKLNQFINKEIIEVNPGQRKKMELLKIQTLKRIKNVDRDFKRLVQSKDYEQLVLFDLFRKDFSEISNIEYINNLNLTNFESKIFTFKEQFESICKMLKENRAPNFKQFQLIHRASDFAFSSFSYHQNVDEKSPILILIKTSNNKKFGAFMNCKMSQKQDWICDVTGLSFIFSLDQNQSYRLKSEANSRLKAAFGGNQGPQIGSGCDIYIYDKCNLHQRNGTNFGGSFKLPKHLQFSSPKARAFLAGEEHFSVSQYQVFHLI